MVLSITSTFDMLKVNKMQIIAFSQAFEDEMRSSFIVDDKEFTCSWIWFSKTLWLCAVMGMLLGHNLHCYQEKPHCAVKNSDCEKHLPDMLFTAFLNDTN